MSNAKERADRIADLIQPFVGARIIDVARSTAASNLQAEGVGMVVEDAHRQRHIIWIDQDSEGTGPGSIQVQPMVRNDGN